MSGACRGSSIHPSAWRNCLEIRNGSRIGATKAAKMGRRSPDRLPLGAKEARSRRLRPTFRTYKRAQAQLLVAACNVVLQYLGICGLSERTLRNAPSTRAPYRRITAAPKLAPHPSQTEHSW